MKDLDKLTISELIQLHGYCSEEDERAIENEIERRTGVKPYEDETNKSKSQLLENYTLALAIIAAIISSISLGVTLYLRMKV